MGRIAETTINRFDGGIENDPRDPRENVCRMVSNFDVLTSPRRMVPYRSSEAGDDAAITANVIRNFAIALRTGTTYSLYGLSHDTNNPYVLYKDLTTGAANDLDDDDWTAYAAAKSKGTGTTNFNLFVYYRHSTVANSRIYGADNNGIWSYDPVGTANFNNAELALTFTNIAQGLVHSKDDILYVPYDNKIAKNNQGSWTAAALTLPSHLVIHSITEYGNYIAIGCAPLSGIGNSRVFLWNRDSSLTTLSESIDWGSGTLKVLEEVDGVLVGISQEGGASSTGIGPAGTISFRDRVIFRVLVGSQAVKVKEITADHASGANTTKLAIAKQDVNNRLYFAAILEYNGAVRDGVWSFGRSGPDSSFALIHERTSNNNTALTTSDLVQNFIKVGDYLFITYQSSGTFVMSKTSDTSTDFAHNSVYETRRFVTGDQSLKKDLVGVTVMHEYLPAAGDVIVQYRVDQNTSWTQILENTTDNSISKSAVNIESSGAALPKGYREIEFRILSTGNAVITGLSFKEEITGGRGYESLKE